MPATSQAQRAYLNAVMGHEWVKAHHFANKGKLPMHKTKKGMKAKAKAKKGKAAKKPMGKKKY